MSDNIKVIERPKRRKPTSASKKKKKPKTNNLNWEHALHDVQHIVCRYLDLEDLKTLTKVSKSWRYSALQALSRRPLIQRLYLQYKFDESSVPQAPDVSKLLTEKPTASLLFFDKKFKESMGIDNIEELKKKLLEDFKKYLPDNVIVEYSTEVLCTDKQGQHNPQGTRDCGIMGLFFTDLKNRLKTKFATAVWDPDTQLRLENFNDATELTRHFVKELSVPSDAPNSIILFFSDTGYIYLIMNKLTAENKVIRPGRDGIWFSHLEARVNYVITKQNISALRVSSPSMVIWPLTFPCRSLAHLELELKRLKAMVKLKRHQQGLISAPCKNIHFKSSSQEVMQVLKSIFPEIPFLARFREFDERLLSIAQQFFRTDPHFQQATEVISKMTALTLCIVIICYD